VHEWRNGNNPQEGRIYNKFTSTTNFERGYLRWDSDTFKIGTEKGAAGGTARNLELQTDGITRATITTGGQLRLAGAGITFNGDTATANELDDYEEGAWTPAVFNTSDVDITSTFASFATECRYVKIGRLVYASLSMATGDQVNLGPIKRIDGLPFVAIGAFAHYSGSFSVYGGGYANRTVSSASVHVVPGTNTLRINNSIDISAFQTNIAISIFYFAD
jgi:hypothetical protein